MNVGDGGRHLSAHFLPFGFRSRTCIAIIPNKISAAALANSFYWRIPRAAWRRTARTFTFWTLSNIGFEARIVRLRVVPHEATVYAPGLGSMETTVSAAHNLGPRVDRMTNVVTTDRAFVDGFADHRPGSMAMVTLFGDDQGLFRGFVCRLNVIHDDFVIGWRTLPNSRPKVAKDVFKVLDFHHGSGSNTELPIIGSDLFGLFLAIRAPTPQTVVDDPAPSDQRLDVDRSARGVVGIEMEPSSIATAVNRQSAIIYRDSRGLFDFGGTGGQRHPMCRLLVSRVGRISRTICGPTPLLPVPMANGHPLACASKETGPVFRCALNQFPHLSLLLTKAVHRPNHYLAQVGACVNPISMKRNALSVSPRFSA